MFFLIEIREEAYEQLIKKLGNDILRLNEAISVTKRAREQSHANLYKLIEELNNRLVKELSVSFKGFFIFSSISVLRCFICF